MRPSLRDTTCAQESRAYKRSPRSSRVRSNPAIDRAGENAVQGVWINILNLEFFKNFTEFFLPKNLITMADKVYAHARKIFRWNETEFFGQLLFGQMVAYKNQNYIPVTHAKHNPSLKIEINS